VLHLSSEGRWWSHLTAYEVQQCDLEKDGQLEKIPGKGTFIKNTQKIRGLTRLSGFNEVTAASGLEAGYKIIEIDTNDKSKEAKAILRINDPSLFLLKRVLLASGNPVGMHTSFIPNWLIEKAPESFTSENLSRSSLHATIEKTGVLLYRAEEIIQPSLAGKEGVENLGLNIDDLTLKVKRTIFDTCERPVLYEIDIYRPDAYTYSIEIYRNR
jgi:GntR family transcriptional regulator